MASSEKKEPPPVALLDLIKAGHFEQALSIAEERLAYEPDSAWLHIICGTAKSELQQDLKEAEQHLQTALELDPDGLISAISFSRFYYLAKDYDQAIKWSKAVLEEDPTLPSAWSTLGWSQLSKHDHVEAIRTAKRAREIFPDELDVIDLEIFSSWVGKEINSSVAEGLYRKLLKEHPNHSGLHHRIGLVQLGDRSKFASAGSSLLEAARLAPTDSLIQQNLIRAGSTSRVGTIVFSPLYLLRPLPRELPQRWFIRFTLVCGLFGALGKFWLGDAFGLLTLLWCLTCFLLLSIPIYNKLLEPLTRVNGIRVGQRNRFPDWVLRLLIAILMITTYLIAFWMWYFFPKIWLVPVGIAAAICGFKLEIFFQSRSTTPYRPTKKIG